MDNDEPLTFGFIGRFPAFFSSMSASEVHACDGKNVDMIRRAKVRRVVWFYTLNPKHYFIMKKLPMLARTQYGAYMTVMKAILM